MKIFKFLFFLLIIGVCVLFYSWKIEPNMLKTEYVEVESEKIQRDVTVAILSDVHLKADYPVEKLAEAVDRINAENPDAVIFLGDLFDNYSSYEGEEEEVTAALAGLAAPLKLCVYGNHDYGGRGANAYREIMENAGFEIFKNQSLETEWGIRFTGLDDYIFGQREEMQCTSDSYNFVFAHAPDSLEYVSGSDFFTAGHSHGGQVRIPFLKPSWLPFGAQKLGYWRGMYQNDDGSKVYVTRGTGTSLYTLRLFNVPEITICKFSKKSVEK